MHTRTEGPATEKRAEGWSILVARVEAYVRILHPVGSASIEEEPHSTPYVGRYTYQRARGLSSSSFVTRAYLGR